MDKDQNPLRLIVNMPSSSSYAVTLVALAAWSGVSVRAIKQWNRDGFFPAPTRKPHRSRRGRSHYRFLASAIPVARRLAIFRRYVTGSDNTKVWLALEGYRCPGVTDAGIEVRLREWHRALWSLAHCQIPSLALVDEAARNEEIAEEILDDLDRVVRQPLGARFPAPTVEAAVGTMALMLGVADGTDVQEWCKGVQSSSPDGRRLIGFIEATLGLLGSIYGTRAPRDLMLTEVEERFLTAQMAALLPRLRKLPKRLDWKRIRYAWQEICSATDQWLAKPETASDSWTVFACQWRRLCYRYPPENTLLALAAITDDQFWSILGLPQSQAAKRACSSDVRWADVTDAHSLPGVRFN